MGCFSMKRHSRQSFVGRVLAEMPREIDLSNIDKIAFMRELEALHAELVADLGPDDLRHLRKMSRWGRLCSAAGYLTAWIVPNPISAYLMSQGTTFRWIVMHHIGHRGYDQVPGAPTHLTSKGFAQGARRYLDWPDWMHPEAWCCQHNDQHHMRSGQYADPDLIERNFTVMRGLNLPLFLKDVNMLLFASTWKPTYLTPALIRALYMAKRRRNGEPMEFSEEESLNQFFDFLKDPRGLAQWKRLYNPMSPEGRQLWTECLLPYSIVNFGAVPALFGLLLGPVAWFNVFINSVMAEIFTNVHSFVIMAVNHAGEDVPRFEGRTHGKAEWYVRQAAHSVNCTGGTDVADFLQGYLNYQIEHHLWPDLPMLKYRQAQPKVEAICLKYGVPYVRENIWRRFLKARKVITGRCSAPVGKTKAQEVPERAGRITALGAAE